MSGDARPTRFEYIAGALVILISSIGVASTVYSIGILSFDAVDLVFWLLAPLGVYTISYGLWFNRDRSFHLCWGLVMLALALSSILYPLVHPLTILGLLLLALAVLGFSAYRGRMR
ncbi:MAG: hypothetical protein N3E44_05790 [Candidatus Bathyarchaeota archaeon]|nr:hypothetical protein [Candidatus Bathyarchaeota archaeon]